MNKKMTYFAPVTEQVMVQFEEHLLDGSINSARDSYGTAIEDTWGE